MERRDFIQHSMSLAGIVLTQGYLPIHKNNPHLSFTTLGCPDWSLSKVTDFAASHGFDAIALRGVLRELDLTRVPAFSAEKLNSTIRMITDKGLKIIELGSSAHLHDANPDLRKNNLDEAKKFIDLAQKLNCPFIRVFPDSIPKEQQRKETTDLIIQGLIDLAEYAKGSQVNILLEPNGDFAKTEDLLLIMQNAANPGVGILWNVSFMWLYAKESPAFVYQSLKKYIKHTHIKDLKLINGTAQGARSYDVMLGEGNVPVEEAVKILHHGNYQGSYCCEWEKFWYPDIREPEIALLHFSSEMKKWLSADS